MRRLGRNPEGIVARPRIVPGDGTARLHRVRDQALIDDVQAGCDIRIRQRRIDDISVLAAGPLQHDVVRGFLMQLWRARFRRFLGIDDHGQLFELDHDRLRGVARQILALRNDHSHRIAREMDFVDRQDAGSYRMICHSARLPGCRKRVEIHEIFASERRHNARHRQCRGEIDALDLRVREG